MVYTGTFSGYTSLARSSTLVIEWLSRAGELPLFISMFQRHYFDLGGKIPTLRCDNFNGRYADTICFTPGRSNTSTFLVSFFPTFAMAALLFSVPWKPSVPTWLIMMTSLNFAQKILVDWRPKMLGRWCTPLEQCHFPQTFRVRMCRTPNIEGLQLSELSSSSFISITSIVLPSICPYPSRVNVLVARVVIDSHILSQSQDMILVVPHITDVPLSFYAFPDEVRIDRNGFPSGIFPNVCTIHHDKGGQWLKFQRRYSPPSLPSWTRSFRLWGDRVVSYLVTLCEKF